MHTKSIRFQKQNFKLHFYYIISSAVVVADFLLFRFVQCLPSVAACCLTSLRFSLLICRCLFPILPILISRRPFPSFDFSARGLRLIFEWLRARLANKTIQSKIGAARGAAETHRRIERKFKIQFTERSTMFALRVRVRLPLC